jgi:Peptidase family M1 domain
MSAVRLFRRSAILGLLFTYCFSAAFAQSPAPNSDPTYQQLRNISLSETVSVSNLTIVRDAATFHLHSGTICFLSPVQGKVTGAVFVGEGNLILDPPTTVERNNLRLLTKGDEFSEVFTQLLLRFTDKTYDEIKKSSGPGAGGCDPTALQDSQKALRKKISYNLDGRILADVLSPNPGGLFVAFVHGKHYSDKEILAIDPRGAPPLLIHVNPEEVELVTYDESKYGVWAAFHYADEYKSGVARGSQNNAAIHIDHQILDITIEKNANLIGKATTTFTSQVNGLRVVGFNLFGSLRVQSITTSSGQALNFIQEDKKDDPTLFVILPAAIAAGDQLTITTSYSGKDAISNEGGGNYYPNSAARMSWYPNNPSGSLGQYSDYDITFHIPKGMKMASTGMLVKETTEGDQNVSVWKSEVPLTVAGFNFGKFKGQDTKLEKPPYQVEAYANQEVPDNIRSLQAAVDGSLPGHYSAPVALGTMTTTGMIKKALAEGELAIELYSDYFGPTQYRRLAMTQQTAFGYGQSWPDLVWLPMTYFYDTTIRHQLGMDDPHAYFKVVAPHEVAHQWWGHTVGFNSYRDQWMSEGFADFSASLYLQAFYTKEPQQYTQFWNDERQLLLERNKEGFRAIDAGPLTMGYRMSNSRTGFDLTRRLIYPKGAFVLHMIRMMMWDRRTGDHDFKELMQDFVKTYTGKSASTEDFQAMVEKHMNNDMKAIGGGNKMDWFFNEYVYGTDLPTYKFDYSFENTPEGDVVVSFKLAQSSVDDRFKMLVPIYLELADGRIINLGRARAIGTKPVEEKVPIRGLKDKPRRAMINYSNDVLASEK